MERMKEPVTLKTDVLVIGAGGAGNNIDLTKAPVEIFPFAHYQMGGIEVDTSMATAVPGLYAAGEVVGGANGANRLSGNALPEALVFGERAGESAARYAKRKAGSDWDRTIAVPHIDTIHGIIGRNNRGSAAPGHLLRELKALMWSKVGAFRSAAELSAARTRVNAMRLNDLETLAVADAATHNTSLVEWCELRNGLIAAEALALAAMNRHESRGAHQRVDYPRADDRFRRSQHIALSGDVPVSDFAEARPRPPRSAACASSVAPIALPLAIRSTMSPSRTAIPCWTASPASVRARIRASRSVSPASTPMSARNAAC